MKNISILIVDDHALLCETWSTLLNLVPGFEVIAESGNAQNAIALTKKLQPDIVLMDVNMPGLNGMDATGILCKISPQTKVIGVSSHVRPAYAVKMMRNGAMGYVTKTSSIAELKLAISEVTGGKKYICQETKNNMANEMVENHEPPENRLTARELEIISFIKKGFSSKEIAFSLYVSVKTIEVHRYNILKKLNLRNSAELINFMNNSPLKFLA
jgi:DNA-binding NarL/FixJ family response regulator